MTNITKDQDGRWINGDVLWNNKTICLASVYAPNVVYPRVRYFKEIINRINENSDWIIGGDFNCNTRTRDTSKLILNNFLQEKNLTDTWHKIYPDNPGYTHFHHATKQPSRIDYIIMSSNLCDKIDQIYNNATGLTDHQAVIVKLNDLDTSHGPGRWICNNNLLEDTVPIELRTFGLIGAPRKENMTLFFTGEKWVS